MGELAVYLGRIFLGTLLLEAAVVLLLKKSTLWLLPCFLGNLLTNPLLNLLYSRACQVLPRPAAYAVLLLLEVCAVLYEAFIYDGSRSCGKKEALRVSLLCNAASFLTGLLGQLLF